MKDDLWKGDWKTIVFFYSGDNPWPQIVTIKIKNINNNLIDTIIHWTQGLIKNWKKSNWSSWQIGVWKVGSSAIKLCLNASESQKFIRGFPSFIWL